jgi:hypothetical protein
MHIHPPTSRTQPQASPTSPFRAPTTPNTNPFGLPTQGSSARPPQNGAPPYARQPTNPIFMDGYRSILEQLLGGLGQVNDTQPRPNYPPRYPQQTQQHPQPDPSRPGTFQGDGHRFGTSTTQPTPQQQQTGRSSFHYSVTTIGPDGSVRRFTNSPQSDTSTAEGRQIVVPTLEDFLGMHYGGNPWDFPPGSATRGGAAPSPAQQAYPGGGAEDPFFAAGGPLWHLAQILESVVPMHGSPGDYLRPVCSLRF